MENKEGADERKRVSQVKRWCEQIDSERVPGGVERSEIGVYLLG